MQIVNINTLRQRRTTKQVAKAINRLLQNQKGNPWGNYELEQAIRREILKRD